MDSSNEEGLSQESRDQYEYNPNMLVTVSSETGRIQDCNITLVERLEYHSKEEVIGKTVEELYHPDCLPSYRSASQSLLGNGEVVNFRLDLRTSQGEKLPVLLNVTSARDEKGRVVQSQCSWTDISRFSAVDECGLLTMRSDEVLQQKKIFEFLAEETNDGWWDWKIQEGFEYMSPRFWQTLGYDPKSKKHDPAEWQAIVFPEDGERALELFNRHVETRGEIPYYLEVRYRHQSGKTATVVCRGKVVEWDEEGRPLRMVGAHSDITQLKETQEKLVQHSEELQKTNHELEQFAYVASHDLQTPLRHISSYAELLIQKLEPHFDEEARVWARVVTRGAERMRTMIDDLLRFSRLGGVLTDLAVVNLNGVVREVLESLEDEKQDAEICVEDLPLVKANRTQMSQLFQNLIGNALKFRKPGASVRIQLTVSEADDHWAFSVVDSGIGMDMNRAHRIFDIFQRLHGTREYEGTGIGLTICKKIVELHRGTIDVESQPDIGSKFSFTLPR